MRGAWTTAVRRILVPVAWKTASKEAVKFGPRSRIRNLMSSNRSPGLRVRVAGLLHGPLAGGVGGDAAQMHLAGAVLDEHQDIQSFQQHGGHGQEAGGEDPGGLGAQELPPGRACAARSWIDACCMQGYADRVRPAVGLLPGQAAQD
jgi:hypothetical protein